MGLSPTVNIRMSDAYTDAAAKSETAEGELSSTDIKKLVLKSDAYVADQFSDTSYVKRKHPEVIEAVSEM